MAAHRFWRLTGFCVSGTGDLELSEARLYAAGSPVDVLATVTCSFTPTYGTIANLNDGLTTGIVAWPFESHSSSGFALVWDLTGSGSSVDAIRLGSGSSAGTFPLDFILQWSDDGVAWTLDSDMTGAAYPGSTSLTLPGTTGQPIPASATSLLHFDGADASTAIMDNLGKVWTGSSGAALSSGWSKFGGSSLRLGGSRTISTPSSSDFNFGSGNFTLSLWINLVTNSGADYASFICMDNINVSRGWLLVTGIASDGGAGVLGFTAFSGATPYSVSDSTALAIGTPTHIAICRDNGLLRMYRAGVQVSSRPISGSLNDVAAPIVVGALYVSNTTTSDQSPDGYIDELLICKEALYPNGTTFTPPSAQYSKAGLLAAAASAPRTRQLAPSPEQMLPADAWPVTTAQGHLREYPFFDAYNGGVGMIYGTTKEKNTPANTPLRRRVLLIDEASRMTIRETWSDALTGNYEFRGVKEGATYTVLSYDHTGAYRAVVADHQIPELIV